MDTISGEIAKWIAQVREAWFARTPDPFPWQIRFGLAFAGALLSTNVLLGGVQESPVGALSSIIGGVNPAVLGSSLFLAGLVSWRKRNVGPIRLFIDGILLPLFVAFLLGARSWTENG